MPDAMLQSLPSSGKDVRESASFTGKVSWTAILVVLGLGLAGFLLAVLRGVPFLGSAAAAGQRMIGGNAAADADANAPDGLFDV